MPAPASTSWRVLRVSGVLPPGFTKRFHPNPADASAWTGVTRWLGIPIDRIDVAPHGDRWALRYRHLPILDVLAEHPGRASTSAALADPAVSSPIAAEAYLRLPGGRLVRFCHFRLEPLPH